MSLRKCGSHSSERTNPEKTVTEKNLENRTNFSRDVFFSAKVIKYLVVLNHIQLCSLFQCNRKTGARHRAQVKACERANIEKDI